MDLTLIKAGLGAFSPSGSRGKLSILLFHKVPSLVDPLCPSELDAGRFEDLLEFLSNTCAVLPLSYAVSALKQERLPARAVAITFDDGYSDWLQTAAPALLKRNLPATFFISTEQLNGPSLWHERIIAAVRALPVDGSAKLPFGFAKYKNLSTRQSQISLIEELQERLKYAPLPERLTAIEMLETQAIGQLILPPQFNRDSVRALDNMGFEIGGHTIKHPILNECTHDEARQEIGGCREELESIIGNKVSMFAYPNGRPLRDYRGEHVDLVKSAGYTAAVATGGGAADSHSDPFQLPRFTPWGASGYRLAVQLARNMVSTGVRVPVTAGDAIATDQVSEVKCLLVASTFPPIHGGSAVVYGNLCEKLPVGSIRVLAAKNNYLTHQPIPGWHEHDQTVSYLLDRLSLLRPLMLPPPANLFVSLYRFLFKDLVLYGQILLATAIIVRKHKINVVCIGELVTGSWLGIVLRKVFGCKLVIYVHGEEVTTATGGRLHGNKRRHYLQVADKVVAVSSFTCDALTQEMGLPPESVALIQNGVDTDRFYPEPKDEEFLTKMGLSGKKLILTVGRLVPRKGIDMAIRAIGQLTDTIPDLHYVVVGGGEYRPELEAIVREEGVGSFVTFAGMVPDEDLLKYLQCCDIFVMPNRTMPDGDTEGFGLVFREANACGKAVIGGRAGGAVEAVLDGETGFLVDGSSPDEIAQAIKRLIQDDALREAMGAKGLKVAKENNTKAVAERFLKVCERLVRVGSK